MSSSHHTVHIGLIIILPETLPQNKNNARVHNTVKDLFRLSKNYAKKIFWKSSEIQFVTIRFSTSFYTLPIRVLIIYCIRMKKKKD